MVVELCSSCPRRLSVARIKQAVFSTALEHFKEGFCANYPLDTDGRNYDPKAPCVFVGLYNGQDWEALAAHAGMAVVILGGADQSMTTAAFILRCREVGREVYVSRGPEGSPADRFTSKFKLPGKRVAVAFQNYSKFRPIPIGSKVYAYRGLGGDRTQRDAVFRWSERGEPLVEHFGAERFVIPEQRVPIEQLRDSAYTQAACYLRTNERGGLTTMFEMAHMGRRTVGPTSTGDIWPCYTPTDDFEEQVTFIERQLSREGEVDEGLYHQIRDHFSGTEWLDEDYWRVV